MPDFFLVGAPKAGTTSIFELLKIHPQVFVPKYKEPNYYTDVGTQSRNVININSKKEYDRLYADAIEDQITGDFSVSYLHAKDAPAKIYKDYPNSKIIIFIRDPVRRAFSHWQMDFREGFTKLDFIDAFNADYEYLGKKGFCYSAMYYECSLYTKQINEYKKYFNNVLVLEFEKFFKNIDSNMVELYTFLNISPLEINNKKSANEAGIAKNQVAKIIYQNSFIRKIAKIVFPEMLKIKLRKVILKKTNKKISNEEYNLIYPLFQDDYEKMKNYV